MALGVTRREVVWVKQAFGNPNQLDLAVWSGSRAVVAPAPEQQPLLAGDRRFGVKDQELVRKPPSTAAARPWALILPLAVCAYRPCADRDIEFVYIWA